MDWLRCGTGNSTKCSIRDTQLEARIGRLAISGRYHRGTRRLEEDYVMTNHVLGTGYNGEVRLAKSAWLPDRKFAVKSIDRSRGFQSLWKDSPEHLQEVENHLCMDHPHVARLYDVYETKKQFHLVMECMEGGDLCSKVIEDGRFSEIEACRAVRQMLLALNYLHNQGIAHRDVKPDNFLYNGKNGGELKLIDFGFSKRSRPDNQDKMKETLGSMHYVAPEVLKCISNSNCSYSTQCDMWSLGATAFTLLTGEMPFRGNDDELMAKITAGAYTFKTELWRGLSSKAMNFVIDLLETDPCKRMTAEKALQHPWITQNTNAPKVNLDVVYSLQQFAHLSPFQQACSRMLAWSLSGAELAAVHDVFASLDTDQHGTISTRKLNRVIIERLPESSDVQKTLDALDHNNIKCISYSDILAAMVGSQIHLNEELLASAFRRFDVDNTGYVTARNLQVVLGSQLDGQQAENFIEEVTQSKCGRMDSLAFAAYLRALDSGDDTTAGTCSSLGSEDAGDSDPEL